MSAHINAEHTTHTSYFLSKDYRTILQFTNFCQFQILINLKQLQISQKSAVKTGRLQMNTQMDYVNPEIMLIPNTDRDITKHTVYL